MAVTFKALYGMGMGYLRNCLTHGTNTPQLFQWGKTTLAKEFQLARSWRRAHILEYSPVRGEVCLHTPGLLEEPKNVALLLRLGPSRACHVVASWQVREHTHPQVAHHLCF